MSQSLCMHTEFSRRGCTRRAAVAHPANRGVTSANSPRGISQPTWCASAVARARFVEDLACGRMRGGIASAPFPGSRHRHQNRQSTPVPTGKCWLHLQLSTQADDASFSDLGPLLPSRSALPRARGRAGKPRTVRAQRLRLRWLRRCGRRPPCSRSTEGRIQRRPSGCVRPVLARPRRRTSRLRVRSVRRSSRG